jgi:hypothetical protein
MASNDYHFFTQWKAPGATIDEVYAVIGDVEALPVWWPSVYLEVTPVPGTGKAQGIGRQFDLLTKGWLPYTLRWRFTLLEVHPPHGSTIGASGDFDGRGIWSFVPAKDGVDIYFDWRLVADKPLLRNLSWLFKPLFALNHQWAMTQGQVSLLRELERRRGLTPASVAPPPAPTTWQPWAVLGGVATVILGIIGCSIYRNSRKG